MQSQFFTKDVKYDTILILLEIVIWESKAKIYKIIAECPAVYFLVSVLIVLTQIILLLFLTFLPEDSPKSL